MDSADVSGRCFGCLWCLSGKNSLASSTALAARDMESIRHLLTRKTKLKAMTKSMFLHLPWTPSRRSPHFGDKEMTGFVRQTVAWPGQSAICIAELIYLCGCLKVCVEFFWQGRLLPGSFRFWWWPWTSQCPGADCDNVRVNWIDRLFITHVPYNYRLECWFWLG